MSTPSASSFPEGEPDAQPDEESVYGVGNWENRMVNQAIRTQGVEPYPESIAWLRRGRRSRDRGRGTDRRRGGCDRGSAALAGGFGLLIGIATHTSPEELRDDGAHVVVRDLGEAPGSD